MRRLAVLVALVAALALMVPAPAKAVMYGEPDGNGHPFVGLVLLYDGAGAPIWRCTGALIAPKLFLTAGHCTYGAVRAQVWLTPQVTAAAGYPSTGGTKGTPIAHPAYDDFATSPNTSDVGVVVLDQPVQLPTYARLAGVGALDSLATQRGQQDVTFKIVGYGLQGVKPVYQSDKERYIGWTKVNNLTSAMNGGWNIQLSSNPGHWSGGLCFGDSGGPVFLGDSNVVVAVNSFVLNSNCTGNGFSYRVDTAYAQSFIGSHAP